MSKNFPTRLDRGRELWCPLEIDREQPRCRYGSTRESQWLWLAQIRFVGTRFAWIGAPGHPTLSKGLRWYHGGVYAPQHDIVLVELSRDGDAVRHGWRLNNRVGRTIHRFCELCRFAAVNEPCGDRRASMTWDLTVADLHGDLRTTTLRMFDEPGYLVFAREVPFDRVTQDDKPRVPTVAVRADIVVKGICNSAPYARWLRESWRNASEVRERDGDRLETMAGRDFLARSALHTGRVVRIDASGDALIRDEELHTDVRLNRKHAPCPPYVGLRLGYFPVHVRMGLEARGVRVV